MSRLFMIVVLVCSAACQSFPESQDVDRLLAELPRISDGEARYSRIQALLESVSNPDNVAEDQLAESTLNRLVQYYSASSDDVVLRAVDDTRANLGVRNAGFATMMCAFYAAAVQSPKAQARYRTNCGPLQGCVGISFSREDLAPICNG